MGIDLSKPSATYDTAQPRMTAAQQQVQQQQQTQMQQSGVLTPNGGTNTPTLSNGATTPNTNPNQTQNKLPSYEQGLSEQRGNYNANNSTMLSSVLPSDGGSAEASGAAANAAANAFLNTVDFNNPFFALKPLVSRGTSDANNTSGSDASSDATTTRGDRTNTTTSDMDAGFTDSGDTNILAQRLVDSAIDRAEQKARDNSDGNGIGDASNPDDAANNPASVNTQDSPQQMQEQEQGSTTGQQKARDAQSRLTQPGGKSPDGTTAGSGKKAGPEGKSALEPEVAGELNAFLQQQLVGTSPKEKALLALLRGEAAIDEALETAQTALGAHGEAGLFGGSAGETGTLAGTSLGELRGALAMHGEGGALSQAGEQVLNNTVMNNSRMLTMLMSNMPSPGNSQPVLAMIAADIFRLQSLRLELMASMRCADEDGELPPADEDEAAMKQRQVQGIGLGEMWRWDLRPKSDLEGEEEEEETAQVWFRTALLTCALQRPNLVAPMFQSTEEAHSVRLFKHDEAQDNYAEQWVQIPKNQPALESFSVNSEHFATWINLAEQAFTHAKLGPTPIITDDRKKNAQAQATALEAILGKPTYALLREFDEDDATRRSFFKAICGSNAPKSLPTVITTREATFADDGLKPGFAYGVLGAFVKDDKWSVILCEDRSSDPQGPAPEENSESAKAFRIFTVSYQAVDRNAASVVFLPGG